jgi:cytochrome c oxidase subunit 2
MRLDWRRLSAALVWACLLTMSMLSTGCAGLQSVLHPAGPQAARIIHLWWLMFWVCTGIFALVVGFLLYAVLHPRQQPQTTIAPATGRRTATVVIAAVVMTGLVLCVFLVADFRTDRALAALTTSQPLKIKITGHQWWWDVQYEATVPSQRVTTANELHLPVGQPVLLELTSHDVIHSFWVPTGARAAPDLTHLASRQTLAAGTLPNTPGHLAGWIVDAQRLKPGNKMPQNSLTGSDLQALLTYLTSLK